MRDYIFGEHVANYMRELKENDPDKYSTLFSEYIKQGVEADDLENLYADAHKQIRAEPNRKKPQSEKAGERKDFSRPRLSYTQRKDRIKQKKEAFLRRLAAMEEAEE